MASTDTKAPDYAKWSAERLIAERDRLAEERTRVRLAQVAVEAAITAAQQVENLSEAEVAAIVARATAKGGDA